MGISSHLLNVIENIDSFGIKKLDFAKTLTIGRQKLRMSNKNLSQLINKEKKRK